MNCLTAFGPGWVRYVVFATFRGEKRACSFEDEGNDEVAIVRNGKYGGSQCLWDKERGGEGRKGAI
jgi:hypothetical protein